MRALKSVLGLSGIFIYQGKIYRSAENTLPEEQITLKSILESNIPKLID